MTDDTIQTLRSMGDVLATLLDGLTGLRDSLRRSGSADAVSAVHLVGLAIEAGEVCGQLERTHAQAQAAALTHDAIRRASGGGAA